MVRNVSQGKSYSQFSSYGENPLTALEIWSVVVDEQFVA
jgi:hypothetical protein